MASEHLCRYNLHGLQEFSSSSNILLQFHHNSPPPKHHPQPLTTTQKVKILTFLSSQKMILTRENADKFTYPISRSPGRSI